MNTKSDTDTGDVILKRGRHFLFTLNNPSDEEITYIKSLNDDDRVTTLVCQEEVGKEGTKHLQFAISYKNPRTFSAVKKDFKRAHIEFGKNKWAIMNYCQKKDTATGNNVIKKGLTNTVIATAPLLTSKEEEIIRKIEASLSNKYKKIEYVKTNKIKKYKLIKWALVKYNDVCFVKGSPKQIERGIYRWLAMNKHNPEIIIIDDHSEINKDLLDQLEEGIVYNHDISHTMIFDTKKILLFK